MVAYSLHKPNLSDYEFLRNIHHVTLKPHVEKIWGWDESLQDGFFKEDYNSDQIQIIRAFGQPVGYLLLNVEADVTHIIDILILPEFQSQKLGSAIIKDLISQSQNSRIWLKLGVYKVNNRAKSLYERLGFETFGETDTHYLMQLKPI